MKPIILELILALNLSTASSPQPAPQPVIVQQIEEKKEKTPETIEYTVKKGDSLTKIAKSQKTTVERLWQKNTSLKDPDLLRVGQKISIPLPDEKLKNRPLPVEVAPKPVKKRTLRTSSQVSPRVSRGSSKGNLYTYGYCTWYVKNRRPDLPNNLGNAITWVSRASNQGIPTGKTPRPGAVGQKGNHVVYVESVNGSRMTISEMNYQSWNVRSSRTVSWSGWAFIY